MILIPLSVLSLSVRPLSALLSLPLLTYVVMCSEDYESWKTEITRNTKSIKTVYIEWKEMLSQLTEQDIIQAGISSITLLSFS
jgi:hypothetical protein